MNRWIPTTVLTFVAGVMAATLMLLVSGLGSAKQLTAAQEQPKPASEPSTQGTWTVVAGEGAVLRVNGQTGESFVLRSYLQGRGQYWLPVDEHIHWRARVVNLLAQGPFSAEFVESLQLPGGKQVLKLKANYRDPGFGFRAGDMISSVREWQNFTKGMDVLSAIYEKPSDQGGVSVGIIRDDAQIFIKVWPALVNLEP